MVSSHSFYDCCVLVLQFKINALRICKLLQDASVASLRVTMYKQGMSSKTSPFCMTELYDPG